MSNGSKQITTQFHFPSEQEKKRPQVATRSRTSSSSSTTTSLKTPRTARFAEATSVNSPIGPTETGRSPFADPPMMTNHYHPQPQPSDVGFGYMSENDASRHATYPGMPVEEESGTRYMVPPTPGSPLKSALKVPGTPGRMMNPLSPTFREEQVLEKQEEETDKQQAKDLKVKVRVRMAKVMLRGVNFSCSLIVLSMLATTFAIFNATKRLPTRSGLPAWAPKTSTWPQIVLLCIACVSLAMSIGIIYAYWRHGHRRAEKAQVYYTVFAVVFFAFSIVMWGVGAGILNSAKANGNGKDLWGWSCLNNKRSQIFHDQVSYALVCRLQNWSLVCCIIEVVVETITIVIYGVVFYRFYSKRKLRKSMDVRNRARSDLYLAQLRTQSAPNTPGFIKTPMSASFPADVHDAHSAAENGEYYGTQYAQKHQSLAQPKPFTLQPPPIRVQQATPQLAQDGFDPASAPAPVRVEQVQDHVPAAPGEQQYAAVPIPGAYASPLASPSFQPAPMNFSHVAPGQAYTADARVESPPSSPRLPTSRLH